MIGAPDLSLSVKVPVQDASPSACTGVVEVGATVNPRVAHWPALTKVTVVGELPTAVAVPPTSMVARMLTGPTDVDLNVTVATPEPFDTVVTGEPPADIVTGTPGTMPPAESRTVTDATTLASPPHGMVTDVADTDSDDLGAFGALATNEIDRVPIGVPSTDADTEYDPGVNDVAVAV